jgi:hypothetical protein
VIASFSPSGDARWQGDPDLGAAVNAVFGELLANDSPHQDAVAAFATAVTACWMLAAAGDEYLRDFENPAV